MSNNNKNTPLEAYTNATTARHHRSETPTPASSETIAINEKARYNYLRSTIFSFTYSLAEILNSWKDGVRPKLFHEQLHAIRVEVADVAGLAKMEGAGLRELCWRLEECLHRLEALNDVVLENLPCGWGCV